MPPRGRNRARDGLVRDRCEYAGPHIVPFGGSGSSRASDEHIARKVVDEVARVSDRASGRSTAPASALVAAEVELGGFDGRLKPHHMTRSIENGMATPVSMYSRRCMDPGRWLFDTSTDRAIPLEPLFVRATCPKRGARARFQRTWLDELALRNPASRHVRKKPEAMPLPPEGRERLMKLVRPSLPDAQLPRDPEAAGRTTLQRRAPMVDVVGVSGAVRDDAARSFAIGFYGGRLEGLRDADLPQLKVRTGVNAARLVLTTELP